MLKAMKRVEKMEAVKEEGPAPSLRGDLSLRTVFTVQERRGASKGVYGSVYDSDVSLLLGDRRRRGCGSVSSKRNLNPN